MTLITGSTGVGKTAVALEVSLQLARAAVPHALIEGDQLDSMYPGWHDGADTTGLCISNLAALWANFAEAGAQRLIMTGVMVSLDKNVAWIREAIPTAAFRPVRLTASIETIEGRLAAREIGSGLETHSYRANRYAGNIANQVPDPGTLHLDTTALSVPETASRIVHWLGWP